MNWHFFRRLPEADMLIRLFEQAFDPWQALQEYQASQPQLKGK